MDSISDSYSSGRKGQIREKKSNEPPNMARRTVTQYCSAEELEAVG